MLLLGWCLLFLFFKVGVLFVIIMNANFNEKSFVMMISFYFIYLFRILIFECRFHLNWSFREIKLILRNFFMWKMRFKLSLIHFIQFFVMWDLLVMVFVIVFILVVVFTWFFMVFAMFLLGYQFIWKVQLWVKVRWIMIWLDDFDLKRERHNL